MSTAFLREAIGVVDGVNDTFYTPHPFDPAVVVSYVAGTMRPFINGLGSGDTGFLESNPGAGEFTVSPPPFAGDTVLVLYSTLDASTSTEVFFGHLKVEESLQGQLVADTGFDGMISDTVLLSEITQSSIDGMVSDTPLYGQIDQ